MTDCFWSLYNNVDEVRIDGLRTVQVQALMKCLSRHSLAEWLLWQEGTEAWRPAEEVLNELLNSSKLYKLPPRPPPLGGADKAPESAQRLEYQEDPEAEGEISLSDYKRTERELADKRASPRFMLRLKMQIAVNGKWVPNETVNISMGGIKLKHPLPDGFKGTCDARIVNGEHEMVLRCRTLQSKDEPKITRLLIEAIPKPDVFRAWILAGA